MTEKVPDSNPPTCARCSSPMVRRTARRGPRKGEQFWGCTTFPKCRFTISDPPDPAEPGSEAEETGLPAEVRSKEQDSGPDSHGNSKLFAASAAAIRFSENIRSFYLEMKEPDANGDWPPEHRRKVLKFIWERDARRCGLCGGKIRKLNASTPAKGPQIEHIVPKVFAVFDVGEDGIARLGTRYTSRLHKMDNLQPAHSYCNRRKGNTPDISKWRHPSMRRLPVARSRDGEHLFLP